MEFNKTNFLLIGIIALVILTVVHCEPCGNNRDFGTNNPESKDSATFSDTDAGYILGATTADCCGVVKEWKADFKTVATTTVVYFQVWRLVTGTTSTYELIGENPMTVSDASTQTITVAANEQIAFDIGDKFGWWAQGVEVVGYKSGASETGNNWKIIGLPDYAAGDTHDWSGRTVVPESTFAVRARAGPDSPPSLSNLPAAGTVYTTDSIGTSIFTVSATDPDTNDVISIAMSPIDGQFDFDTTTNVLSLGTLTASSGPVNLTFTVTDQCLNTDTNIFTVIIVNPSPIIHDTPIARNVSEDIATETLLFTVNVTDADLVTCSKSTSVPASYPFFVRLIPSTSDYGIYSSGSPGFDYDVLSQYALQVDCTDGVTTVTSNDYLVYLIENESPVLVNLQNAISLTTVTGSGVKIFTVNITDPEGDNINCSMTSDPANAPFDIFDSGAIYTTQDLSGETNVGYDLFISCSDGRNTVGPETLTVTYTVTTTTAYTYKTFFEDPRNLAWFIPCMMLLFCTLVATLWVFHTCRGKQGWRNFVKNFINRQKLWKEQGTRTYPETHRQRPDTQATERVSKTLSVRNYPPPVVCQPWRVEQRF